MNTIKKYICIAGLLLNMHSHAITLGQASLGVYLVSECIMITHMISTFTTYNSKPGSVQRNARAVKRISQQLLPFAAIANIFCDGVCIISPDSVKKTFLTDVEAKNTSNQLMRIPAIADALVALAYLYWAHPEIKKKLQTLPSNISKLFSQASGMRTENEAPL